MVPPGCSQSQEPNNNPNERSNQRHIVLVDERDHLPQETRRDGSANQGTSQETDYMDTKQFPQQCKDALIGIKGKIPSSW